MRLTADAHGNDTAPLPSKYIRRTRSPYSRTLYPADTPLPCHDTTDQSGYRIIDRARDRDRIYLAQIASQSFFPEVGLNEREKEESRSVPLSPAAVQSIYNAARTAAPPASPAHAHARARAIQNPIP